MAHSLPTLAILGGGLAGMAAAAVACRNGWRVELFERTPTLGGRAGSFRDRATGESVDYCQHVGMGCCTEFIDFIESIDVADCFERHRTLHFVGSSRGSSDGKENAKKNIAGCRCDVTPSAWLPAPLHLLPGFAKMAFLSWSDRFAIARAMAKLVRRPTAELLAAGLNTVGPWLRHENQSPAAIERFWNVVLVGALSESVDQASLAAAQKVFRDGFWNSRHASELLLPKLPLSEIFHDRGSRWLADHGVAVHCGAEVHAIDVEGRRAKAIRLSDGSSLAVDACIVAVAWRQIKRISIQMAEPKQSAASVAHEWAAAAEKLAPAAITAVHYWFDRPVMDIPHAVLVDHGGQWLFAKPWQKGQHIQAVVSASHRLPSRMPADWIAEIRREIESLWPAAHQAKLLHAKSVTQPAAVFSITPDAKRFRPAEQTPFENVFLAGDWTATGWPATMEGAIRSGRQAARLAESQQ